MGTYKVRVHADWTLTVAGLVNLRGVIIHVNFNVSCESLSKS